ncbi:MAG: hypothetical protein ABSF54_07560 [Bryobacteraceae bacterium]|jgi:hypothetical protein
MREIGIFLLASFAIDRIVTGMFYLLSFNSELSAILDPDAKLHRLIYAVCAGYLGVVVVAGVMGVRLSKISAIPLDSSAGPAVSNLLDVLITGLLLAGGADRLAEALKLLAGEVKPVKAPIEITGKIVLEQRTKGSEL